MSTVPVVFRRFAKRAGARESLSPWPLLLRDIRHIAAATAVSLVLLSGVEVGVFRSGLFASRLTVADPDFPSAKIVLAARHADASILYVGDSTVLTDVAPLAVSDGCAGCGDGYNGAFSAATPWLTAAMTRELLAVTHPRVVVIGLSPWTFDSGRRFVADDRGREFLTPAQYAAMGVDTDLMARADAAIGQIWSAYRYRTLAKEWLGSAVSRQRYDEGLRGVYAPPGTYNQPAQLEAAATRMVSELEGPASVDAAGSRVIAALADELRAKGRTVVYVLPPLHSLAYRRARSFLSAADEAASDLAVAHGVPLIDCRASVNDADFRDIDHLLPSGADRFSRCVGERLQIALAAR